jgi:hypothetical protein
LVLRRGDNLDEVDEGLEQVALHREALLVPHVLDLLGDVLQVEIVG